MGPEARRRLCRSRALTLPTTVHLVRHAAHALLPHTLAGRRDVPLSPDGEAQAEALAGRMPPEPAITAIVSSPVARARQTAAPIAARLGLAVELEAGFTEIDFGDWAGQRFDALAPDPAWQRWNRHRALAACPGGETMHEAQSRALLAMARLHAAHPGRAVVVVSHADVLKAILAAALGLSLDLLHRLTLDPASCSTLTLFDADLRVDGINR